MTAMPLRALLAIAIVVATDASPKPASPRPPTPAPCVFPSTSRVIFAPCAPFTNVGLRVLHAVPNIAFGKDLRAQRIAVLDDGSVMVQTDGLGLYQIVRGHVHELWAPNPACSRNHRFAFDLAGPLNNEVLMSVHGGTSLAVRADGSLAFRLTATVDSVVQDSDGVVWWVEGRSPNQTLHAYVPATRVESVLQSPKDIYKLFRSPNGNVYVSNFDGLFRLVAAPMPRAQMVRGPLGALATPRFTSFPVQAVGRDGSLWTATSTEIIHVHPNGEMREMLLIQPPTSMSAPWGAIQLKMAPDGSVWTIDRALARIGNDDRITVVKTLKSDQLSDVQFGPDSSVWVLARNAQTGDVQGIVNFVAGGQPASRWPFTAAPPTPPSLPMIVQCPPPTPPATPTPPLPPASGRVAFVYVADSGSFDVRGFWVAHGGQLIPVRGSPFGTQGGHPAMIVLDPAGRHLYAGTSYHGILGYALDRRSGTLSAISGSPFASGYGPSSVAITGDGRYAYSANANEKTVTGYSIDPATGALHQLGWAPRAINQPSYGLAINPVRNRLYVAAGGETVETFDIAGGALNLVGTTSFHHEGGFDDGMLVDRQGKWLYVSHDWPGTISVSAIDPQTGVPASQPTAIFKAGSEPRALVTDPRGKFLYVTNIPKLGHNGSILGYRLDERSGMLSPLPTSPFGEGKQSGNDLTITPNGAYLYATSFSTKSVSGYAIDRDTGSLWPLPGSPFAAGDFPEGIVSCCRTPRSTP